VLTGDDDHSEQARNAPGDSIEDDPGLSVSN
jgi:hypothetical protein